jgi:hypothetical protein
MRHHPVYQEHEDGERCEGSGDAISAYVPGFKPFFEKMMALQGEVSWEAGLKDLWERRACG